MGYEEWIVVADVRCSFVFTWYRYLDNEGSREREKEREGERHLDQKSKYISPVYKPNSHVTNPPEKPPILIHPQQPNNPFPAPLPADPSIIDEKPFWEPDPPRPSLQHIPHHSIRRAQKNPHLRPAIHARCGQSIPSPSVSTSTSTSTSANRRDRFPMSVRLVKEFRGGKTRQGSGTVGGGRGERGTSDDGIIEDARGRDERLRG